MHKYWTDAGLTEKGAELSDKALPLFVEAISLLKSPDLAKLVLAEALFQVHELPKRTAYFQRKYHQE